MNMKMSKYLLGDRVRMASGPHAGVEGMVISTCVSRCGRKAAVRFRQLSGDVMTAFDSELEPAMPGDGRVAERLG
jgi:hypothetical protein